ncbi:MAG: hypothetical protein A2Y16_03180 [Tenericutes bacterium GWF2_57_13]|nr:MAG: hypothetical protein A2Y16_03180 [Tenericutes bacterium GWF2_57_13]
MPTDSALTLKRYVVKDIRFSLSTKFDFLKPQSVRIEPQIDREFIPLSADDVIVVLKLAIHDKDTLLPFSLDVAVEGSFGMKEWQTNESSRMIIENNATAILFPYLRSLVTGITAGANIPPYILPVMNIVAYFEKKESNKR